MRWGTAIIGQMLGRLYFADLALADMTIANGNVYCEVGIRHAAQKTGCVLLSADWQDFFFRNRLASRTHCGPRPCPTA